jgi:hypothetical protein
MSHLYHQYRDTHKEATLPDVFFDHHPTTILVGLAGSAAGMFLAVVAPGSFDSKVATVLNTIWITGWTVAGLYRVYRWATERPKVTNWVQPVSDDDTPTWKGRSQ